MKKTIIKIVFALLITTQIFAQLDSLDQFHNSITLKVSNDLDFERIDELVSIDINNIINTDASFNLNGFIVYQNSNEIASQVYSSESNTSIIFVSDFNPKETKIFGIKYLENVELRKNYKPRTYAELAMKFDAIYKDKKFTSDHFENYTNVLVPQIHTDHDALFKYEGPGWESEKVGYRFYLDWRNATDIFGKKVNELVLHNVGVNDVTANKDSYHEMHDWGMDIFKVGSSLGIGSIGMMNDNKIEMVSKTDEITCDVSCNGPLISEVKTNYKGWAVGHNKFKLNSRLSISAGSRITKVKLLISEDANNITTGLAKHDNTKFIKSENDGDWQYIALYGKQSLADDNLGIVLFYKNSSLVEQIEDDLNYYCVLKPEKGNVEYSFGAAWEKELNGIKNINEFEQYLNEEASKLNSPLDIKIKKGYL